MKSFKILLIIVLTILCSTIATAALTDSIVAYYPNDETGAVVIDSTNKINGTIDANPLRGQPGIIENSTWFDATNDYINADNIVTNSTFTLSYWFNTTGDGGESLAYSFHADAGGGQVTNVRRMDGVPVYLEASFYNVYHNITEWSTINDSVWHHIVLVGNNTVGTMYVDGVSKWTGAITATHISTAVTFGGHSGATTVDWFGGIDEMGFWNQSLTPTDVTNLYNGGAGLPYPFVLVGQTTLTTGLYNETYHNISLVIDEGQEIRAWASYNFTLNNSEVYPNGYCNFSADNILQEDYFKNTTNTTVCTTGCDFTNHTYEVTGLDTEGYIKDYLRFNLCRSDAQTTKNYVVATSCGYTETFSYNTIELCSLGSTNLFINTTDCGGATTNVNVSIWTTGLPNTRNIVLVNSQIGIDREHNHTQELLWNNTFKTFYSEEREYYEHGEHEQTINCYGNNSLIQNKTLTYNVTVVNKPPTIFIDIIGYNKTVFPFINNTIAYRVGDWLNITGGCQDDDLSDYGMNLSFTNGTVIDSVTFSTTKNMIPLTANYTITNFSILDAYLDGSSGYKSYFYCNDTSNNVSSVTKHFTMINNKPVVTWLNTTPLLVGSMTTIINWTVTDAEGAIPKCYLFRNGTINSTGVIKGFLVNVSEGTYNYTVRCEDGLRNSTDKTLILTYSASCIPFVYGIEDGGRYRTLTKEIGVNCTNGLNISTCWYYTNKYSLEAINNCTLFNVTLAKGWNNLGLVTNDGFNTTSVYNVWATDPSSDVFDYVLLWVYFLALALFFALTTLTGMGIFYGFTALMGILIGYELVAISPWVGLVVGAAIVIGSILLLASKK